MADRKITKKYYFSVEGETEHWYLKWLQKLINDTEQSKYKVSFDCPIKKNPLKHAKSLNVIGKIDIYHFFDYESNDAIHVQRFTDAMAPIHIESNILLQLTGLFMSILKIWMNLKKRITSSDVLKKCSSQM